MRIYISFIQYLDPLTAELLVTASGIRPRRQYVFLRSSKEQRAHLVLGICSLGDDVPIELVKPILQNCSAETLLRLEHTSPVCLPLT